MSYTIKEQLANSGNYGGSRNASQIRYLVYHYTGNDGDKAANNAAYFQRNIVKASAHYFVDDTTVYLSVPELKIAWSVGGSKYANADKTGGGTMYGVYQASEATLANAAALGRALMEKYGIPIENVYRHFDVTGKHCPSYLVSAQKWAEFKKRLEVKIMDNTPSGVHKEGVEWAIANGILTGNGEGDLMLSQPVTRQQMCTMLHRLWELIRKE